MSNTNSTIISTLDATNGKNAVEPYQLGGRERVIMGTVAVVAADIDADLDTVVLCRLPGLARLTSLQIAADDLGVDEADLGLYSASSAGAAASEKDLDVYVDDIDLDGAATALTEVLFHTRNINLCGQTVAEDAGDTPGTDDDPFYDLVLTRKGTTGTELPGDISFIVKYVID